MQKAITVPVTTFTSIESVIHKINEVVADKNVTGIFYTKSSLIKGEVEILVDENTQKVVRIERPSKQAQQVSIIAYIKTVANGHTNSCVKVNNTLANVSKRNMKRH